MSHVSESNMLMVEMLMSACPLGKDLNSVRSNPCIDMSSKGLGEILYQGTKPTPSKPSATTRYRGRLKMPLVSCINIKAASNSSTKQTAFFKRSLSSLRVARRQPT